MNHTPRHAISELRQAIEWLESEGWTINEDGTITRTQMQVKKITHDPRTNAVPRHTFWRGRKSYSIKVTDLIEGKFGRIAAKEQPDEAKVEHRPTLSRKRALSLPA